MFIFSPNFSFIFSTVQAFHVCRSSSSSSSSSSLLLSTQNGGSSSQWIGFVVYWEISRRKNCDQIFWAKRLFFRFFSLAPLSLCCCCSFYLCWSFHTLLRVLFEMILTHTHTQLIRPFFWTKACVHFPLVFPLGKVQVRETSFAEAKYL